jgi:hypothetical protein
MKEKLINWLIKFLKVDTNKVSDGFHTFEQLYEHRIELWIALCKQVKKENYFPVWKTYTHSDGTTWPGWFLLGMYDVKGLQMTYHLPEKYWKRLKSIPTLRKAPEFDGHTSDNVIKRLQKL